MTAATHVAIVESSTAQTYDWLDRVGLEIGDDDRHLALQALRAVFHALRDELSVEQSAHLTAQFPTYLRGIYFDQWHPGAPAAGHRSLEAFLARIGGGLTGYTDRARPQEAARAVFAVIEESLSGNAEKIKNALPKAIRDFWE